jgi:hypothetical protein
MITLLVAIVLHAQITDIVSLRRIFDYFRVVALRIRRCLHNTSLPLVSPIHKWHLSALVETKSKANHLRSDFSEPQKERWRLARLSHSESPFPVCRD